MKMWFKLSASGPLGQGTPDGREGGVTVQSPSRGGAVPWLGVALQSSPAKLGSSPHCVAFVMRCGFNVKVLNLNMLLNYLSLISKVNVVNTTLLL